jgi:outer membrane autotransporter protein
MKRIAIAAAAAVLMMGAAQAQTRTESPLYGEIGYTFHDVKVDTGVAGVGEVSANPQALRGVIGYNFHPYFALEGHVGIGTSSDDFAPGGDFKVDNSFGVFVKPKYAINNFELFGRLGWARTKVKVSGAGGSASGSDNDFAYGVGANYNFNPRTYVGLDYMRLLDKDGVKVNGLTVSVGYRF